MISRRRSFSLLLAPWLSGPALASTLLNAAANAAVIAPSHRAVRMVATEFPPYTGAKLPEGGVATAITRAAWAAAGHDMVLEFRPWARAVAEFQQGEHDGVIAAWLSPERLQTMNFPRDLGITNRIGFMARVGHPHKVDDLGTLKGLRIGTVRGYANPERFERARLPVELAMDDLNNLRKLAAGRVDLALIDKGVAFFLLQTQLGELAPALSWCEPAVAEVPLYTALSKGRPHSPALLEAFNKGMAEIASNGQLQNLLHRLASWN